MTISGRKLVELARGLRGRQPADAIATDPEALSFRDAKGRNLLHLCCSVDLHHRGLAEADGIRTADVLLESSWTCSSSTTPSTPRSAAVLS